MSALGLDPYPQRAGVQFDECLMIYHALDAGDCPGVMVDVGAHFGGSLVPFAAAGWEIWAFEPDPENRARLEKRLRSHSHRLSKVEVSPLAVSDSVRTDEAFYTSSVSTGISGLVAFHDSHVETDHVNTTTLDRFIKTRNLDRIDFLKIDVEGHELAVLRGLDFNKIMPRAIVAEFEDSKTRVSGYDSQDLSDFLQDRGYTVFVSEWHPIEQYGRTHSWRCIRQLPYVPAPSSWGNFVAFLDMPPAMKLDSAILAARTIPSKLRTAKAVRSAVGRLLRTIGVR